MSHMRDYSRGQWHPRPIWIPLRKAPDFPVSHSSGPISQLPSCDTACMNGGVHYGACAGTLRCRTSCPSCHKRSHPRTQDSGKLLPLFCYCNPSLKIYGTKLPVRSQFHKSRQTIFSFSDENIFSFLCPRNTKYFFASIK